MSNKFNKLFQNILSNLSENSVESAGLSPKNEDTNKNSDSYAPGDARMPKVLRGKKKPMKGKCGCSKKKKKR